MAAGGEHGAMRQWVPLQRQLVPAALEKEEEAYSRNVRRRQREAMQDALRKGFMKTLDQDLILQQWRDDSEGEESSGSLEHVLRVSLPRSGVQAVQDVALLSCPRLRICNLPHCFIRDLSAFYGCVNLLKLDLSNNQIEHVPPADFWFSLSSLRVLYLHGNNISDKISLQWMNHSPRLHVLTLHSTPFSLLKDYRHHVVNGIMSLQALDKYVISDEEIIENTRLQGAFQAFSPQLKLQLYHPYNREAEYFFELRGVYQLLLAVNSTLAHCSPVHIVQRWIRGWLTRRALLKTSDNRIKSLVSKYQSTRRRTQSTAPPPPNTACLTKRPTHTSHPASHHTSNSSPFKTRWNISLPAAPSASPAFSMTPERLSPSRARSTSSPQHSRPLESHTVAVHSGSSRMHHSICINLNHLEHSVQNQKPPTTAAERQQAKKKGHKNLTSQGQPRKTKRLGVKEKKTKDRRSWITVVGEKADVLSENNLVEKMAESKKEAGEELREAEAKIMEAVEKTQEPPPKESRRVAPPTTIHGAPRLSKDELAFSRVFESMTLSTFKAVDRIHDMQRMKENWERKDNHVAKMKSEREIRRKKIQDFQLKMRDTIETWKIMEENKLTRLRDKATKETMQSILDRSLQRAASEKARQKDTRERSFAAEFARQSVSIGRDVTREDREISLEEKREEIKEQVRQVTEATRQRRQEAKAEKEIRAAQLVWEGELAKKELSRKMMQAAARRMSEAKSRVGRAAIKREAAKASVERAKEMFRKNAGREQPVKLPPLKLDLRPESELVEACRDTLQEVTNESTPAPFRLRCFTHEANRTWQRGTLTLAKQEKAPPPQPTSAALFPDIDKASRASHQLRPGPILHNTPPTPLHSELTEPSPCETPTEHCDCGTAHPWHPMMT